MKERPVSEITPPQGEAGGRKRPNEDETRVRHEGEKGKAQEGGGLTAPKCVREAPRTQWEGKCCYFYLFIYLFICSRNEEEKSLQGETYRRHSRWNEAGASFNAGPSSDERQMHLNVVKCSN
ncbi:hypothetical protein TNCV_4087641 [Trichonephila clavipes]|uniref:Uncharacterized protein n=1 Tax=Trichonephila clavipes TaxID=2585209 RepID=A0A8X6RHJ4_TRICX|nr:hypothetical protein TNCV_4087641 [Trichonephila clavipes]